MADRYCVACGLGITTKTARGHGFCSHCWEQQLLAAAKTNMKLEKICKVCDSFITVRMHTNNTGKCDHCHATSVNPHTNIKCEDCELGNPPVFMNGMWRHWDKAKQYSWVCGRKEGLEPKLKLFEAELEADEEFNHAGFYIVLLAVDLESAKAFAQKQFNVEYEGVIDVYEDDVKFSEIEGPFRAGTILASLHY